MSGVYALTLTSSFASFSAAPLSSHMTTSTGSAYLLSITEPHTCTLGSATPAKYRKFSAQIGSRASRLCSLISVLARSVLFRLPFVIANYYSHIGVTTRLALRVPGE